MPLTWEVLQWDLQPRELEQALERIQGLEQALEQIHGLEWALEHIHGLEREQSNV